MTGEMEEQVTWSDLGFSFGKMYQVHSAATRGETSRPCWRKLSTSQSLPFLYLDLRENGQRQEPLTVMGGLSLGELMMLNTGESPNAAVESRLSQILEDNPQEKYSLSAKACQGILRRAERRGKDLPKLLKAVLIRQSQGASPQERTEAPAPTEAPTSYAVRIRGGCDGGGKGALVQTEKSGTLGTGNDQTIFCMATQQGGAQLRTDDRVPTLTAAAGMSGNNQPVVALEMSHACDVIRDCGEVSQTLQARMGTGGNQVPLTYQMQGFGDYRAGEVASSCKQRDFKDGTDLAITNMAVRRLTPVECERLQGFPDGWTDIGEWVDEEGRTHKQADSPRYKALGNSIALPFWHWMFCRMAEHLPGKATLGSLFDGIGGFPLCWESIHGKGTARWASEIEKFPMAVTKLRFPEEA